MKIHKNSETWNSMTSCGVDLTGNVQSTDDWGKVTCKNCLKSMPKNVLRKKIEDLITSYEGWFKKYQELSVNRNQDQRHWKSSAEELGYCIEELKGLLK